MLAFMTSFACCFFNVALALFPRAAAYPVSNVLASAFGRASSAASVRGGVVCFLCLITSVTTSLGMGRGMLGV